MSEYKVKLEVFEGPMALLMHLIEKHELDIYDIPIAQITEQYLDYLKALEEFNIDIASEFLVMAATLLQIKSRVLLPKPPQSQECPEDEQDLRQELIERLLEYRKFKQLAILLENKALTRQRYFFRQPQPIPARPIIPSQLALEDLIAALVYIFERDSLGYTLVEHEEFSIQEKMDDILTLLRHYNGKMEFKRAIIRSGTRSEIIAAFLALLELIRIKEVAIQQEAMFGPIYLTIRGTE